LRALTPLPGVQDFPNEGEHLRACRVDQVTPADQPLDQQRGLVDRAERGSVGHRFIDVFELCKDGRAILRQNPLSLIRKRVPRALAQDLADQRLMNRVDAVFRSHAAEAATKSRSAAASSACSATVVRS
jgi:hypothetical protein